jgi:hypothetical protein
VESSRVILGTLLIQFLHFFIILMRLLGTVVKYVVDILLAVYDIIVSVPLWVEYRLTQKSGSEKAVKSSAVEEV